MNEFMLLGFGLGVLLVLWMIRNHMISSFKIAYYEKKLKNREVDISHVENITLWKIVKLP